MWSLISLVPRLFSPPTKSLGMRLKIVHFQRARSECRPLKSWGLHSVLLCAKYKHSVPLCAKYKYSVLLCAKYKQGSAMLSPYHQCRKEKRIKLLLSSRKVHCTAASWSCVLPQEVGCLIDIWKPSRLRLLSHILLELLVSLGY